MNVSTAALVGVLAIAVSFPVEARAAQEVAAATSGATSLTLDEAMAMARSSAYEIAAAASRAAAGEQRLTRAKSERRPALALEQLWIYTDSPAEVFGLQLSQERFSLPDFAAGDPNDPDFFDDATTRLELTLPVYSGGEIKSRIDQAKLGLEAAQARLRWTSNGAALLAAEAFVRLHQARQQVSLLETSLETVEGHVAFARAQTEAGTIVRSELLRAEVEHARIADLLSGARGNARVAEANLSFRLGQPRESRWRLQPPSELPEIDRGLETWFAEIEQREDLAAMRRQVQAARLEERARRAILKPRVGVALRHELHDELPAGTAGSFSTIVAQGRLELWGGGRHRASVAEARAEAEAATFDLERMNEAVRLELRQAFEQHKSARERLATATAAGNAAAEAERITGERFRAGVVRTVDLLDAVAARREAETREVVARADALLAALRLVVAAGREPESLLVSSTP